MISRQFKEHSGVVYDDYLNRILAENANSVPYATASKIIVTARRTYEGRVDGAARALVADKVALDTAPFFTQPGGELLPEETYQAQMYPLTKFHNDPVGGFDLNIDGFVHVGMYPDLLQDMRNTGVTHEYMEPLFNAAESYVFTWERACKTAEKYRAVPGAFAPPPGTQMNCGP
jgi:hypothetical protein